MAIIDKTNRLRSIFFFHSIHCYHCVDISCERIKCLVEIISEFKYKNSIIFKIVNIIIILYLIYLNLCSFYDATSVALTTKIMKTIIIIIRNMMRVKKVHQLKQHMLVSYIQQQMTYQHTRPHRLMQLHLVFK